MKLLKFIIFLLIASTQPFADSAKAQSAETPVVSRRAVSERQWQKASAPLDYSKELPPKPPKERRPKNAGERDWGFDGSFGRVLGNILQVIAILIATAGIAYGIYRMMQAPRNRAIASDGAVITLENLETYIHETDLKRFLREALEKGDYAQAVRVYFLQIIKDLSLRGRISWSREKTNREYLRSMRSDALYEAFSAATLTYEQVWYGAKPIGAEAFAQIEPSFKNLLDRIGAAGPPQQI